MQRRAVAPKAVPALADAQLASDFARRWKTPGARAMSLMMMSTSIQRAEQASAAFKRTLQCEGVPEKDRANATAAIGHAESGWRSCERAWRCRTWTRQLLPAINFTLLAGSARPPLSSAARSMNCRNLPFSVMTTRFSPSLPIVVPIEVEVDGAHDAVAVLLVDQFLDGEAVCAMAL